MMLLDALRGEAVGDGGGVKVLLQQRGQDRVNEVDQVIVQQVKREQVQPGMDNRILTSSRMTRR